MTNVFNASAAGDPDSVEVCLDIPLSDDANPCTSTITGQCSIAYRGKGASTNPGGVLACPALLVIGTVGGRDETWGRQCGNQTILPGTRDFGSNVSPVYDLNIPAQNVGYPVLASNTPSTIITIDAEEKGDPGYHNYFIDAYLRDTTQNPASDGAGGNYTGINAINGRSNKTWNAAIFIRHPNLSNIQSFTGGQVVVPSVTIGGNPYEVRLKHEQGGQNNFPQLIFVWLTPDATTDTYRQIDFRDISNYMLSNAFWTAIQGSAWAQSVITAIANPTNGAPAQNVIRPNGSMWWEGFKAGANEIWGTVNDNAQTTICYNELKVEVAGAPVGPNAKTTSTLSCGLSEIEVTPGQTISAASFVTGGTPPYTATSATGVFSVVGGAVQVANTATAGTSLSTVVVSDATSSQGCVVTVNVVDGKADCIDIADSTVTVSPSPATAGTPLVITADINPSSGGLVGHSLVVKDPDGTVIGIPSAIPVTNQWNFQLPIASLCQDGTYRVCVVPPSGACAQWDNAAVIPVTGCDNAAECSSAIDPDQITISGVRRAGEVQTIVVSRDACNCPGSEIIFKDGTQYLADGSLPVLEGFTYINSHMGTFKLPNGAPEDGKYQVYASCCTE